MQALSDEVFGAKVFLVAHPLASALILFFIGWGVQLVVSARRARRLRAQIEKIEHKISAIHRELDSLTMARIRQIDPTPPE